MPIKQRYQNLALGDQVRLQSYVYNNGFNALIYATAKVEIFYKDPNFITQINPQGLIPFKTIVSRFGQPTQDIYPGPSNPITNAFPQISSAEFWETILDVDSETFRIGDYVDKWHFIADPDYDIAYPTPSAPYNTSQNYRGDNWNQETEFYVDQDTLFLDLDSSSSFSNVNDIEPGIILEVEGEYDDDKRIHAKIITRIPQGNAGFSAAESDDLIWDASFTPDPQKFMFSVSSILTGGFFSGDLFYTRDIEIQTAPSTDFEERIDPAPPVVINFSNLTIGNTIQAKGSDLANFNILADEYIYVKSQIPNLLVLSSANTEDSNVVSGVITSINSIDETFILRERFQKSRHHLKLNPGRSIRIFGITNVGPTTDLDYTEFNNKLSLNHGIEPISPGPSICVNNFSPPINFYSDPVSFAGYVLTKYTTNINGDFENAVRHSYYNMQTSNGISWDGSFETDPSIGANPIDNRHKITSIDAEIDSQKGIVYVDVVWRGYPLIERCSFVSYFVEQWDISNAIYSPNIPNPWDDLIERTDKSKYVIAEHNFKINPEQFFTSPRPIQIRYDFSAEPEAYYVGTNSWMRVDVKPEVPFSPETERYYFGLLSAGRLRYELYRLTDAGGRSVKIKDGIIDWHENNFGLLRIDTTRSPLNRGMDCSIVFFVDLPDGSTIRSGRIIFQIIDDRRQGVLIPRDII